MERRVFLLEFVNADQSPGRISESLPFIAGRLTEQGVPLRWLRFAVSTTNLLENARDRVTLTRDEATRLREAVAEFRPTVLICTDGLAEEHRRSLRAAAPGLRLHESFSPATESLLRLLDRPGFWPRYDWEAGNAAASRKAVDNIYLNHLDDCGYRRCTFCQSYAAEPPPPRTPAAWFDKQLEAVARSRRAPGSLPHAVLLSCLPHPDVLELCLEGLRRRGMEGVRLLMAVRTNQVPSVVRLLRRSFEANPGSRIAVGVYASGIESFDAGELTLYNKGTRPLDGIRAVNELRELAADHPGRFSYEGLSFLLFTPWTTLESLELNYGIIRHLGMGDDRSNLYQCRLRLHDGLPLTALAEQHGLIVDEETDPVMIMNRRKLFSSERAWRFADPRVRPVSRIVLRYDLLGTPLADALTRRVERALRAADPAWRRGGGDGDFLLGFTLCAIAAARAASAPLDEAELLSRTVERWRAAKPAPRRPELIERPRGLAAPAPGRACLYSFDGAERAELAVVAADDESLIYAPDAVAGRGRLPELLRRGRRLLLAPGQIQIVAESGEIVEVMTVTHGLWSAERSWHAAEWAELARAAVWSRRHARKTPEEGVLLVEFAAIGRYTLGVEFPLIHSWLKRTLNLPVRWVRFALDPDARFGGGESGMGLDEDDLGALLAQVRDFPARKVLFSFRPADSLWARLREALPSAGARFLTDEEVKDEAAPGDPAPSALPSGDASLLRWLGAAPAAPPPSYLEAEPDFGYVAGNRAAREMQPLAFVIGGEECVYRKSVVGNPAYAGVPLEGHRTDGCAFCVTGGRGPAESPRSAGSAVEGALTQIRAFFRTYPLKGARLRPRLRLSGQDLLLEIEALAREVAGLGVPPTDLLFDARIDYLLRLEGRLAAAAASLKGTGHKVHICLVGLENFSASELLRLNKGILPAQSLAAIRALRRLERERPSEFGFEEHGGLSTILFTPWTTLEDLALNFAVARHFRLERLCGKLLTSRVRLYETLPLTALARRDGLLVDRYDDPALDTARRNFYPDELAWRFLHPEVEAVSRIATRMLESRALAGDPLYARVQEALSGARASGRSYVESACALIDRALAHPGAASVEHLLGAWSSASSACHSTPDPNPDSAAEPDIAALLKAQREGRSLVNRHEMLADEAAAEGLAGRLRAQGAFALTASRRQREGAGVTWDVFFGARRPDVEEAARLTELQYKAGAAPKALAEARRRLGVLYGYPECCAAAFAAAGHSSPCANSWMLLLHRSEHPGSVDPALTPYAGGIKHVPCSASCRASVETARGSSVNPVLFLLDRIDEFVELIPRGPVGRTFDFDAGAMSGEDPALRALAGGGTIEIGEGIITVSREGARVASFPLRAAVWWHGQAFDPEFWRECALEHLERREEPAPPPSPARARVERKPAGRKRAGAAPDAALVARVRASLSGARVASFVASSVEPGEGRFAVVTLKSGDGRESLIAHVEPLEGASRYFKAAGDLAFGWSEATPPRTRPQIEAMAALIALLGLRPRRPAPSADESWEPGAGAWEGRCRETLEMLAFKPVSKIEPVHASELMGWKESGLPNPLFRRRGASGVWELFTGRRPEDVKRAAALTAKQNSRGPQEGVTEELGRLLGYPACCARAYAGQPRAVKANSFWSYVANRVAVAGPVPPDFSPLNPAIEFFPCSLRCAATVELSRKVLAASPVMSARVDAARLRNPFLFILGEQGAGVELLAEDEPGARFRYRAGEVCGRGPDVEAAAAGDEIVVDEDSLLVRRGGRTLADLSGRSFLWWHGKAFQTELWTSILSRHAAPDPAPAKSAGSRERAALARALASIDKEFSRLHGVSCRGRREGNRLAVTIARRAWTLIVEAGGGGPAFARAGSLRVCVEGRQRMSPAEEKRLKAYVGLLARCEDGLSAAIHEKESGRKRSPK